MNNDPSARPTVVIGEHSFATARELGEAFSEAGFRVVATCTDGLSLVASAREHQPAVLCLDIILPRLSGLQALEALRGQLSAQIVVATAVSSRSRVAEAKRLGASVYILKPFDRAKLLASLRSLLPASVVRSAS